MQRHLTTVDSALPKSDESDEEIRLLELDGTYQWTNRCVLDVWYHHNWNINICFLLCFDKPFRIAAFLPLFFHLGCTVCGAHLLNLTRQKWKCACSICYRAFQTILRRKKNSHTKREKKKREMKIKTSTWTIHTNAWSVHPTNL